MSSVLDPITRRHVEKAAEALEGVITMGCGDARPIYPGKRYEDWQLDDPAEAASLESVRAIRDDVDTRVKQLVRERLRT